MQPIGKMKNNFRIAINETNVDEILEGLYLRGYTWHSGTSRGKLVEVMSGSSDISPTSCLCITGSNTFGHSGDHSNYGLDWELLKLSDIPLEIKHEVQMLADTPTRIVYTLNGVKVKIWTLTNKVKILDKTIFYQPVTTLACRICKQDPGKWRINLKDPQIVEFLKLTNCI